MNFTLTSFSQYSSFVVSAFVLILKFKFLSYDNAKAYTYFTYIDKVLDGQPHPNNMTKVKKFKIHEKFNKKIFKKSNIQPTPHVKTKRFLFSC